MFTGRGTPAALRQNALCAARGGQSPAPNKRGAMSPPASKNSALAPARIATEDVPLAALPAATQTAVEATAANQQPVSRSWRFLAVAPDAVDLAAILEIVYTAYLMRQRQAQCHTAALVHPQNVELLQSFALFDEVEAIDEERAGAQIRAYRPQAIYLPDRNLRLHLASAFSGARLRIGGSRSRLLSAFLRTHRLHLSSDLEKLQRRGLDLFPELVDLRLQLPQAAAPSAQIWISIFEEHDLTGAWPAGHAARLARMCATLGLKAVFPAPTLPQEASDEVRMKRAQDLAYLRSRCPEAEIIDAARPMDRALGIANAALVVCAAGPESVLAAMLGRPVVILHDMKSHRDHPGLVRPAGLHSNSAPEERPEFLQKDGRSFFERALQRLSSENSPLSSYLIRLSHSFERHVAPTVEECINACQSCGYHSCVEYISPERVFEQIKKTTLPF
ncbi:MAG: hypothetical protein K1X75_10315 [Leptospirales bacterium]|nr:hypothetical protein [Leptospirales bacterium]